MLEGVNSFESRSLLEEGNIGLGIRISSRIVRGLILESENRLQINSKIKEGTKIWFKIQNMPIISLIK